MDHDNHIGKLIGRQNADDLRFAIVQNHTVEIHLLEEDLTEFISKTRSQADDTIRNHKILQGTLNQYQEDVDTRFLLIDSSLRFFNETVYRAGIRFFNQFKNISWRN